MPTERPPANVEKKTPELVPRLQVPTVLFVGDRADRPGQGGEAERHRKALRPVPQSHSCRGAKISLKVLTPDDVQSVPEPMKTIAKAAYTYTQALRQGFAVANLGGGNAASLVGMTCRFRSRSAGRSLLEAAMRQ